MIVPKEGDIVDFQLVQNGIFGDKRIGVKVLSPPQDYLSAKFADPQLDSKHTALYPYFASKVGNVDDPTAYKYITVLTNPDTGAVEVIGVPWILESTYKTVTSRTATYVVQNFREEFRAPIQKFLTDLGAKFTTVVNDD